MLGVRLGMQMKDSRRPIHNPHIALADEMGEIIVPGEAFAARFLHHSRQFAPQPAVGDPANLRFEIDPAMPYLQRGQPRECGHVRPVGFDGCRRMRAGLLLGGSRTQCCDRDTRGQAFHVDCKIDARQRLVEIIDVE